VYPPTPPSASASPSAAPASLPCNSPEQACSWLVRLGCEWPGAVAPRDRVSDSAARLAEPRRSPGLLELWTSSSQRGAHKIDIAACDRSVRLALALRAPRAFKPVQDDFLQGTVGQHLGKSFSALVAAVVGRGRRPDRTVPVQVQVRPGTQVGQNY